ncbi:MAG: DUF4271 domain-containing protein [Bacteroidota bacterium]
MSGLKYFLGWVCVMGISFTGTCQVDTATRPETTRSQTIRPPVQKQVVVNPSPADSGNSHLADSVLLSDNLRKTKLLQDSLRTDSLRRAAAKAAALPVYDTSTYKKYETHPWLPLHKRAIYMLIDYHSHENKDDLFYLMAGIVLVLALIRAAFSKYFRNLFLLFFQTAIRQKQTRDQLLQDNLASLLTNFLFLVSAGLYITLIIRYKNWTDISFWWLALGSAGVLLVVYLAKYLFLLFTGWVFNTREAAGSYVFVVFLVNKILGIVLIPFLLLLSFASPAVVQVAITISVGIIGLLFAYRYWVSFIAIRNKLKVNALHFLLYLCAVELLPLVLIYKVLINYFSGSF